MPAPPGASTDTPVAGPAGRRWRHHPPNPGFPNSPPLGKPITACGHVKMGIGLIPTAARKAAVHCPHLADPGPERIC